MISSSRLSHLTLRQDYLLALALTALWMAGSLWHYWGHWGEDLSALFMAGHLWATGQTDLLYDAPPVFFGGTPPLWLPDIEKFGLTDNIFYPFIYPPLWAAVFAPLSEALGPEGFNTLFLLIEVPLLAASVWLAGSVARPETMPHWIWVAIGLVGLSLFMPGIMALFFLQPSVFSTFLCLLAFERLKRGHAITAGVALGLAVALKLSPILFAAAFLIERRPRALASTLATVALCIAASIWLCGLEINQDFLAALRKVNAIINYTPANAALNASLVTVGGLLGLAPPFDLWADNHAVTNAPLWVVLLPKGALLATLVLLWPAHSPAARPFVLMALGLATVLFGPLGWLHYLLIPGLLAPAFFSVWPTRKTVMILGLFGIAFSRIAFAGFEYLPWHTACYQWMTAVLLLTALWGCIVHARRAGKIAQPAT